MEAPTLCTYFYLLYTYEPHVFPFNNLNNAELIHLFNENSSNVFCNTKYYTKLPFNKINNNELFLIFNNYYLKSNILPNNILNCFPFMDIDNFSLFSLCDKVSSFYNLYKKALPFINVNNSCFLNLMSNNNISHMSQYNNERLYILPFYSISNSCLTFLYNNFTKFCNTKLINSYKYCFPFAEINNGSLYELYNNLSNNITLVNSTLHVPLCVFPFYNVPNSELSSLTIDSRETIAGKMKSMHLSNDYLDPFKITNSILHKHNFTFLNLNIRSLNKNISKLEILLQQMKFNPSVIFVTETWLHCNKTFIHSLKNYNYISRPGSNKAGGTGLFIHSNIDYNIINNLQFNLDNCEDLWVEIELNNNNKITLGSIYRHPTYDIDNFKNKLLHNIEILNNKRSNYIIAGDMNIDWLKNSKQIKSYKNEILSQGVLQTVTTPTHLSENNKSSIIDHIYTNMPENKILTKCIAYDISDHVPSISSIGSFYQKNKNINKKMIRFSKNFNSDKFLTDLKNELNLSNPQGLSADGLWDNFERIYISVLDKHVPLRPQSRKENKTDLKPWLSKAILKSIRIKQKLFKNVIKNPSTGGWNKFKKYRNKLTHIIEQAKRNYFKNKINKTKSNTKKLWKTVNEIINFKPKKLTNNINICYDSENNKINSNNVSNLFNKHFSTIGVKLSKKIDRPSNKNFNYLSAVKPNEHSIFINPITETELLNYISKLNPSSSTKSNSPPIKFIKLSATVIAPFLVEIFNTCISEGVFPSSLKSAEIVPIFKKGDKNKINNWRPISLLSPFSKILEHHLYNQINKFITKYKLLHNFQYGFRENSSTELAITQITDELQDKLQKKTVYNRRVYRSSQGV